MQYVRNCLNRIILRRVVYYFTSRELQMMQASCDASKYGYLGRIYANRHRSKIVSMQVTIDNLIKNVTFLIKFSQIYCASTKNF